MKRYVIIELLDEAGDVEVIRAHVHDALTKLNLQADFDYRIIAGNEDDPLDGLFEADYSTGKQLWLVRKMYDDLLALWTSLSAKQVPIPPEVCMVIEAASKEVGSLLTKARASQLIDACKDAIEMLKDMEEET